MRTFLLLLAMAGQALSWHAGFEYKYKYRGSIMAGIPEIKNEAAQSVIQADIIVQVEEGAEGAATVKIADIKVGEKNGEASCHFTADAENMELSPVDCNCLEKPFKVFLNNEHVVIEEDSGTNLWRTNLRKAIISIFANEVLRGNLPQTEEKAKSVAYLLNQGNMVPVFTVEEETILGRCQVDYYLNKLPETLAARKKHQLGKDIIEDAQSGSSGLSSYTKKTVSKTRRPSSKTRYSGSKSSRKTSKASKQRLSTDKFEDDLYRLTRSVNFDKCSQRVELQAVPAGLHQPLGGSHNSWFSSRSSASDYLLRGSPGNFRVEEAIVEGGVTMLPLGVLTEILQTRTNQTYKLVSVTPARSPLVVDGDTHQIKTWMQEVASPYPHPSPSGGNALDWVRYSSKPPKFGSIALITGEDFEEKDQAEIKKEAIQLIEEVSLALTDLDQEIEQVPGSLAAKLEKAKWHMFNLPKDDIKDILQTFFDKESDSDQVAHLASALAVDVAAALAVPTGVQAILELAENREMDVQIASIFVTLTSTLSDPLLLPTLIDYAVNMDLAAKPFSTTIVWSNLANLIKKFCFSHEAPQVKYPGQLLGDMKCDTSQVTDKFITKLKHIIEDTSTSSWEKTVAVWTLQAIGSPLSIPILTPVALGESGRNNKLRSAAVYGLARFKLPPYAREQCENVLMEIFHNLGEDPEIRQSALGTLISWYPTANFWHQLARQTWREPSRQMVAFISSTLDTVAMSRDPALASMSQIALHASKFAKPTAPSVKYSYNIMEDSKNEKKLVEKFENAAWLSNTDSLIPNQIYYFMMSHLGGLRMINLEWWISSQGLNSMLSNFEAFKTKQQEYSGHDGSSINHRIAEQLYKTIKDVVITKALPTTSVPEAHIWIKFLENHILYFPLRSETLNTLPIAVREAAALIVMRLTMGSEHVMGKFVDPANLMTFLPTELGVPMSSFRSSPVVISKSSFTTLDAPDFEKLKKFGISQENLLRISTKIESRIEIHTPWLKSKISTGVTSTRDLLLPIDLRASAERGAGVKKSDEAKLSLEFSYRNKFSVLHAANSPFTSIEPIYPLSQLRPADRKVISKELRKDTCPIVKHHLFAYTGLQFELTWNSNLPSPFKFWSLISGSKKLLPMAPLLYLLESPTAQAWTMTLDFDPKKSTTNKVDLELSVSTLKSKEDMTSQYDSDDFTQHTGQTDYDYQQKSDSAEDFYNFEQQSHSFDSVEGLQQIFDDDDVAVEKKVSGDSFRWDDTDEQRSEKIRKKFDSKLTSVDFKITFGSDQGGDIIHEAAYLSSELINEFNKRKVQKSQLILLRSPIPQQDLDATSICFDYTVNTPVFSNMDSYESMFKRDLNSTMNVEVRGGCTGEPVITASADLGVSSDLTEKWKTEMKDFCDYDQYDPLSTFFHQAFYDKQHYEVKWKKVCDRRKFPMTTWFTEVVDDLKIEFCDKDVDFPRKFVISLERDLDTGRKNVEISRGHHVLAAINDIEDVDGHLDMPITHFAQLDRSANPIDTDLGISTKCIVKTDFVRSFDGYVYTHKPGGCWRVAVQETFSGPKGLLVLVRSPEGEQSLPEVRLIDVTKGMVVELARGEITVNGEVVNPVGNKEVIKNAEGKVSCVVRKEGNVIQFRIPSVIVLTLKDNLEIMMNSKFATFTEGLCGNFNGEAEDELLGPQYCAYGDPEQHVAAWSGPSDRCNIYALLKLRSEAEKIEKTCKPIHHVDMAAYHQKRCTINGWEVRNLVNFTHDVKESYNEEVVCVTETPVSLCEDSPKCYASDPFPWKVEVKCWAISSAPAEVRDKYLGGHGNILQTPVMTLGEFKQTATVYIPSNCLKLH